MSNFEMNDFDVFEPPKELDGIYPFTSLSSKGKISKSKNKMVVLDIKVFDTDGNSHLMTDYFPIIPRMKYKIDHYWESVGCPENIDKTNKVSDFSDKSGHVLIKPIKNEKTGIIEIKVSDYVSKESAEKNTLGKEEKFPDEDVPF
jgi:hypothetical protein